MPTSRRIPPQIQPLARAQSEIVARTQLRALADPIDRRRVRYEVSAERWARLGRNVIALHTGTLTREQRLWRAILGQGEQLVALAGPTAAEQCGLTGLSSDVVHVVVRHGARVHPLDGVKVHVSRRFTPDDLHPTRRPPMVRLERAVVDAAVWTANPRQACAILASAVQQRLTTAERLSAELARSGHVRHRRLLSGVLVDIAGGAHALSELDFMRLCRRHELPQPRQQVVRRDGDGRRRWLDAVFPMPDGRELVVEVDGAAHLTIEQYADDLDRTIELVIGGKTVVRVAAVTLRLAEQRVAGQLARLLGVSPGTTVPRL